MKILPLLLLPLLLLLPACRTGKSTPELNWQSPLLQEAIALLQTNRADCVLVAGNRLHPSTSRHGVSPLLELFDGRPDEFAGGIIVDKVIGRAAAAIAICGKARAVHGEIMSEDAVAFLQDNGLAVSYGKLVPRILNRRRDGLCPLEKAVAPYQEPQQALQALRTAVAAMQQSRQNTPPTAAQQGK